MIVGHAPAYPSKKAAKGAAGRGEARWCDGCQGFHLLPGEYTVPCRGCRQLVNYAFNAAYNPESGARHVCNR